MKIIHIMSIAACLGVLQSCNIINPEEPVPAYIAIDKLTLQADYTTQGSSSSAFSDAWLYVDNQSIGGFEMPTIVPVIADEGNHLINIAAGVKASGFENIRSLLALFTFYDTTVYLKPGVVSYFSPVLKYKEAAKFDYIEDFDDGGIEFIKYNNSSDTTFYATNANPFEGDYSAIAWLDNTRKSMAVVSKDAYVIDKNRLNIIEVNYKCSTSFNIGVSKNIFGGTSEPIPFLTLYPTSVWKKIYIDLSPIIGANVNFNAINYKLYISAFLDADKTSGDIQIDNLKLVHL
ncbi:MAG TPA: hypothetical protein PK736_07590 [Bacteroidia bacterium]|nr:hypothetical protein [Bacteroidia bacterium]